MKLTTFRENDGLERWERWTEWPLLALGLIFLVAVLLPLASPLSAQAEEAISTANWLLWGVFALDYFIRLWLSRERWHFVKTHLPDLIIVAVPPFRALRLLRLISIFLVFTRRARSAPYLALPLYVAAVTATLIGVSAVLIYDAEAGEQGAPIATLGDALWWAFTTVTTVGYGDEYPITPLGRFLGVVLMLSGITLLGSLTASAAAWLTNTRRTDVDEVTNADLMRELRALRAEVEELRKFAGH